MDYKSGRKKQKWLSNIGRWLKRRIARYMCRGKIVRFKDLEEKECPYTPDLKWKKEWEE